MKRKVDYDVVIIGAGHNGLTCAHYLAEAGYSVKMLEKRWCVGGAAVTEEFHPGYRNSMCSYEVSMLNPKVIEDMKLFENGLQLAERDPVRFIPTKGKDYFWEGGTEQEIMENLAKYGKRDPENYKKVYKIIEVAADIIRESLLEAPPNLGGGIVDLIKAGKLGLRMNKLDHEMQVEVMKLFTMSISAYLDRWFDGDLFKGMESYLSVVGNFASPYADGTAYVLLHHMFGEVTGEKGAWAHAIGGMGSITQAMARACESKGVSIEVDCGVNKVLVENGVARGVVTEDGRTIRARAVVSNTTPTVLFQKLLEKEHVDDWFYKAIEDYRCESATFRMNVALKELPRYTCIKDEPDQKKFLQGSTLLASSVNFLQNAYNDAIMYGYSKEPIIEMCIPSLYDDSLAPEGHHVMSLFCQHFRRHLPNGQSWDDIKEDVADMIIDRLAEYAPNIKEAIVGRVALSPLDLEREWGLTGGDIFHGVLSLDQIFAARPVAGYADYRMPVSNLYLCGAGTHPGGGVTGVCGHNAAKVLLKDLKRRRVA